MKILLTADPIGGVWTYALDLARALAGRGVTFVLATMGAALRNDQRSAAAQLPNVELHESEFALEWMEQPWEEVDRAGRWLQQLARESRPDLIHLNGYAHAALAWPAPVLVVAHSCVLSWWRAVKSEAAPNEWNEYRRRVSAGLRAADFVVAPTQAMLAALKENYEPLPRCGVIPNGRSLSLAVDASLCEARAKRSLLLATPGSRRSESDVHSVARAAREPFIFSAGRFWDEAKNLATLKAAASAVDWPVYVAGSEGEEDAVISLGRLSSGEMNHWLSRASIYCLPARYEPFGLSALEAGLAGCALVLGDISSLREVWGDAAVFVNPDDDAALATTLQELIADPRRREELGRLAFARARRFTAEKMGERYFSLYCAIVRQARALASAA